MEHKNAQTDISTNLDTEPESLSSTGELLANQVTTPLDKTKPIDDSDADEGFVRDLVITDFPVSDLEADPAAENSGEIEGRTDQPTIGCQTEADEAGMENLNMIFQFCLQFFGPLLYFSS